MIVEKPWGKVTTYALNQPSSVRVITIDPGQETSEHYHQLRDEMWTVLDEGLRVQIGNRVVDARPGDEFVVSAEHIGLLRYARSRDVLRLQDDYGRPLEPEW